MSVRYISGPASPVYLELLFQQPRGQRPKRPCNYYYHADTENFDLFDMHWDGKLGESRDYLLASAAREVRTKETVAGMRQGGNRQGSRIKQGAAEAKNPSRRLQRQHVGCEGRRRVDVAGWVVVAHIVEAGPELAVRRHVGAVGGGAADGGGVLPDDGREAARGIPAW